MPVRILWLSLLTFSACGQPEPTPVTTTPPAATPAAEAPAVKAPAIDPAALGRARATMMNLGSTLKGKLVSTMKAEGPNAALGVCAQDAQSLTASVATTTGVSVGRSSLRLRNPSNAGPEWVTAWLTQQGERKADGIEPQATAAVRGDGTQVVRVVAPLPIEAPCLVCHGPKDGRSAALSDAIAATYPTDQANDYALGDLRGAIWAEAPIVLSGLHLELDGGAKWALDESTRNTLAEIRTAVAGPPPADLAAAHAVGATLDGAVSRMIQGCSMEGASHDQLHHFLEGFFPALSALKKASEPAEAHRALWLIQALVADADAHFE